MQSPIDIPTSASSSSSNANSLEEVTDSVNICYSHEDVTNVTVQDKGYTVQVDLDGGSLETKFANFSHSADSLQFHIHAPAEHTIDGKLYDLELHIVHKVQNED